MEFDVVTLPETEHVETGDTAPDFVRPLVGEEYWEDTSLDELTDNGRVLLVFYPMNGSFPATYIWNELTERRFDDDHALTVVGVTTATPYDHQAFIENRDLPYRLFSDPKNTVAVEYGVAHDLDGMTGVDEPRAAVFLLDTDRTVEYAWVATEWPEFPDYDELEAAIEK